MPKIAGEQSWCWWWGEERQTGAGGGLPRGCALRPWSSTRGRMLWFIQPRSGGSVDKPVEQYPSQRRETSLLTPLGVCNSPLLVYRGYTNGFE
uniref:Uncharacterized protein n=1 Tax=Knipowitschia caucasica TaxID=637954 RepID=A0AAV2K946_KNICA